MVGDGGRGLGPHTFITEAPCSRCCLPRKMGLEMMEPNTCIRGCCSSDKIPIHLPPSRYSLSHPIARGGESVVYEALLDAKRVAVKKPILSTSQDIDKFHKELQLLCTLDHPGVAQLVAAHAMPPNYMFFFELYDSGNLSRKLHVDEWTPSIKQALEIATRLAKALQYLHNLGIVHRDVKPANILLDRQLQPHLADFGLADFKRNLKLVTAENWKSTGKPTGGFHKKNMVGTLIYMAPEVLRKEIHTEKSDVYSFGVSVNELLTGVVPYTDLRAEAQAHTVLEMNYTEQQLTAAVVSECLRPVLADLQSGAPASLLSLIERCWDKDPQSRPSFDDIAVELDSILEHENGRSCTQKASSESFISSNGGDAANIPKYQENISWFSQGKNFQKRVPTDLAASTWLDSSNDNVYSPVLSWGSFASCGRRETMEDRHFLMPQLCDEKDIHAFGIFDGHRGNPYALSRDHVASCLEERKRIIRAGGLVKWQVDTWRVGDAALQVTRSIGDDDLKPAVTAEPEITLTTLSAEDEYIVMASDGLWDVVSNDDVVNIIRDTVKEPGMCSKRLATEAAERGSKDNITVIVVFLRPVSTAERIY